MHSNMSRISYLVLVTAATAIIHAAAAATDSAHPPATNPSSLRPNFTAVLVFGDSTMDTGNNNHVPLAVFKADHRPYGGNFLMRHSPTGRFCDGRLIPDMVASLLNIKEAAVPAYMDPDLTDEDVRTGVVFASAGTGYDDMTAAIAHAIPMFRQVEMFKEYIGRLGRVVGGEEEASRTVGGALIMISSGTNDFVDNYYDLKIRRLEYDLGQYQDFLLGRVEAFVKEIYSLGGRFMVVSGLPPIGCLPVQMSASLELFNPRHRSCIQEQNSDSQSYNAKLEQLLAKLQASLPGSKIVYANVYDPLLDMVTNPEKYGFEETKRGCCGSGLLETAFLCSPFTPSCGDEMASKYVFFDSIHPTEATYKVLAATLAEQLRSTYSSPPPSSSPSYH